MFQRHPIEADPQATDADVRYAYRLLLGRQPDPEGLAVYGRLIRDQKMSADDLARFFLASDEFRTKHRDHEKVEVPLADYSLFVSPDDRDIGAAIASKQVYEPYVEMVLRKLLKTGDTFVDVGANIGYFTALGAFLVGPAGRVCAWEPIDANVQLILATAWRNRFENVVVFPFAASSEAKLVPMVSQVFSSSAGIVNRAIGETRTRIIAQAQRLDDLLGGLQQVDVIKFDIEGHELHAWQGAANLLARHRPHVLTEFHPKCIRENTHFDPADYLRALLEYADTGVEVLHRTRANVVCRDIESILREWQSVDDEFRMNGAMHIDLYVRAPGR
jgi:FkbM family methyltransferase